MNRNEAISMSFAMQNMIAFIVLAIVIIFSWLLAANYHNRRSNPSDYEAGLVKGSTTTLSNKSLPDSVEESLVEKESTHQDSPTPISPTEPDQTNVVVANPPQTSENNDQTPTTVKKKEDSTSRLNIFTIIILVLLIVGTFLKRENRNS